MYPKTPCDIAHTKDVTQYRLLHHFYTLSSWLFFLLNILPIHANTASPLVAHIGTYFCDGNFTICSDAFNKSIAFHNTSDLRLVPVNLLPLPSASDILVYVCDAVASQNISLFVAVGDTESLNLLSLVTAHTEIPLLGYTTDKTKAGHKV
jgi:hypothetical protein